METFLFWCVLAVVGSLSVVTFMYAVEIIAAFPAARFLPEPAPGEGRPMAAILVPAHDEEAVLAETLAAIRTAKGNADRVLVVADNCSDRTAGIARAAGAEVLERQDAERRGKGYALDAGLRLLAENPPDIVIVIDADCKPAPDAIERLVRATVATGRPVQALYLMTAPADAGIGLKVAEFAFALKNRVRMRGLQRLGLPCHLTGAGMSFPWRTLWRIDIANGHLVEDMKLGLDLACQGHGPVFCEDALVLSPFPVSQKAMETQRSRWIGGHIALTAQALRRLPGRLLRADAKASLAIIATIIPPMTILLASLLACLVLSTAAALFLPGGWIAAALSVLSLALFLTTTLAAWHRFGRAILPAPMLKELPRHLLFRLARVPTALVASRGGAWIRTDRGGRSDT